METQTVIILFLVLAIMALAIVAFKNNKSFKDTEEQLESTLSLATEPKESTADYRKLYLEEAALNGELKNALDHIRRVALNANTATRRLDFIVARASGALKEEVWDRSYQPMPRTQRHLEIQKLRSSMRRAIDLLESASVQTHHLTNNNIAQQTIRQSALDILKETV